MNARELDQLFKPAARKIVSAEIAGGQEPAPGGEPRVIVTLDDGSRVDLFAYRTRDRPFNPADFVGLSVADARRLQ